MPVLHVPFVLWVGAEIERHAEAAVLFHVAPLFLAGQELVRRRQVLLGDETLPCVQPRTVASAVEVIHLV